MIALKKTINKTMSNDKMSPEQWDYTWYFRNQSDAKNKLKSKLRAWAMKDFSRMVAGLLDSVRKPCADIIELGCAPGLMLKEMHQVNPCHHFSGIDYSRKGLELAQTLLKKEKINATLIFADIRKYIPEKTYDLVISFGLIEHFDDPEEILNAHKRYASKNSLVIVTVPNLSNHYVKNALEKFRPVDLNTHHLDIMSERALFNIFQRCGFRDIETGGAVGPLLPTPFQTPTLASSIYKYFSYIWNGSIRFIPPQITWHAYYWAKGRI